MLRENCANLQKILDETHSTNDAAAYYECQKKYNEALQLHVLELKQKSKVDWLTQGDEATKFFYAKMTTRRHYNCSTALITESGEYLI